MPRGEKRSLSATAADAVSSRTRSKTVKQEGKETKKYNDTPTTSAKECNSTQEINTKERKLPKQRLGKSSSPNDIQKSEDASNTTTVDLTNDGQEERCENEPAKKRKTGSQSNAEEKRACRSSPRLAIKIGLKYADKVKLQEMFGHTDVKPAEVPDVMKKLISRNDAEGLKWLLDMGFQPFSESTRKSLPIYEALWAASFECLELLLNFGQGLHKKKHDQDGFKMALAKLFYKFPKKTPFEMPAFMRCVKLILGRGITICTPFPCFPLPEIGQYLEKNSAILTFLYVAGQQFQPIPCNAHLSEQLAFNHPAFNFHLTKVTAYIANKFFPDKDEDGFFQPDTLEDISRVAVRKHLIACNHSNLFLLVPQLPVSKPIMELLLYYTTLDI